MSASCFNRERRTFRVVINDEEQYSLWPESKSIPGGWRDVGMKGNKRTCLEYVERKWAISRSCSLHRVTTKQTVKG